MADRTAGIPTLTLRSSDNIRSISSATAALPQHLLGRTRRRMLPAVTIAFLTAVLMSSAAVAQQNDYYHPLNQRMAPGEVAGWLAHIRGCQTSWMQPIRVTVPGGAQVSIYHGPVEPTDIGATPAMVAVNPGHTYRLRLTDMPEYPDVELYPSIEILDRLHPPAGEKFRYPIPIPFSRHDIAQALDGRLVTRVIYLEKPQIAQQLDPLNRDIQQAVPPSENVLQEADRLGRPMVIVRLGSRRPAPHQFAGMFYGTGGPIELDGRDEHPPQPQLKQTALRTP